LKILPIGHSTHDSLNKYLSEAQVVQLSFFKLQVKQFEEQDKQAFKVEL